MHELTEQRIHKRRERPEGRSLHICAHACVPYYQAVPSSVVACNMLRNHVPQGSCRTTSSPQKLKIIWGPQKEKNGHITALFSIRIKCTITTQFLTYVSNSYISLVHFPPLL